MVRVPLRTATRSRHGDQTTARRGLLRVQGATAGLLRLCGDHPDCRKAERAPAATPVRLGGVWSIHRERLSLSARSPEPRHSSGSPRSEVVRLETGLHLLSGATRGLHHQESAPESLRERKCEMALECLIPELRLPFGRVPPGEGHCIRSSSRTQINAKAAFVLHHPQE